MTTGINQILKKKKWTGSDLGRLALANTAVTYARAVENDNVKEDFVVSKDKIGEMLDTLKDPEEIKIYNGYLSINNWIGRVYPLAMGQMLQASHCLYKMLVYMRNIVVTEQLYKYIKELPFALSESALSENILSGVKKELEELYPIDQYEKGANEYKENVEEVENSRDLLFKSAYYVQGFDKIIELIASIYKVEEIKLFNISLLGLKRDITHFNNNVFKFYNKISKSQYINKEDRIKKLKVIQDVFYPINTKKLELPKKAITQAKRVIKDFNCFRDRKLNPATLLCFYDPKAVKDEPINWEKVSEGV